MDLLRALGTLNTVDNVGVPAGSAGQDDEQR